MGLFIHVISQTSKVYIQKANKINRQIPTKIAVYGLTFIVAPSFDPACVAVWVTTGTQVGMEAGVKLAVGIKVAPAVIITVAKATSIE